MPQPQAAFEEMKCNDVFVNLGFNGRCDDNTMTFEELLLSTPYASDANKFGDKILANPMPNLNCGLFSNDGGECTAVEDEETAASTDAPTAAPVVNPNWPPPACTEMANGADDPDCIKVVEIAASFTFTTTGLEDQSLVDMATSAKTSLVASLKIVDPSFMAEYVQDVNFEECASTGCVNRRRRLYEDELAGEYGNDANYFNDEVNYEEYSDPIYRVSYVLVMPAQETAEELAKFELEMKAMSAAFAAKLETQLEDDLNVDIESTTLYVGVEVESDTTELFATAILINGSGWGLGVEWGLSLATLLAGVVVLA